MLTEHGGGIRLHVMIYQRHSRKSTGLAGCWYAGMAAARLFNTMSTHTLLPPRPTVTLPPPSPQAVSAIFFFFFFLSSRPLFKYSPILSVLSGSLLLSSPSKSCRLPSSVQRKPTKSGLHFSQPQQYCLLPLLSKPSRSCCHQSRGWCQKCQQIHS